MSEPSSPAVAGRALLYLVGRIVPAAVTFVTIGVLTRFLSPEEYGTYAIALSVISLFSMAAYNWLYVSIVRLRPMEEDAAKPFQAAVLVLYLVCVALVLSFGALYVAAFSPWGGSSLWGAAVALFVVQGWLEINLHFLISRSEAGRYVLVTLLRSLLVTALAILAAALGGGAASVLLATALAVLGPALWLTFRQWRGVRLREAGTGDMGSIARFGLPLAPSFLLDNVIFYADRLILGWLINAQAVGLYAVGYDLADRTLKALMYSIGSASLPAAVQALEIEGEDAARRQLAQNLLTLVTFGLPATVGLCLTASELSILVGSEFRDVTTVLIPLVAVATFLACIRSSYLDHAFHLARRPLPLLLVTGTTALFNVSLNILLIPSFGLLGAAYANLAAFIVAVFLAWSMGRSAFRLPYPWRGLAKIAAACAAMGIFLAMPIWPEAQVLALVLKTALGGAVFVAVGLLLRAEIVSELVWGVINRLASRKRDKGGTT
ncbi:oligosaccharide flippase family protein [Sabulicella glaciei]|uniref:Oligosaccharide flippase family protein n=1 Tax=Sabulicella glaciei TaxID=2984948 RepID=A0ABT3P109_9PROT|nr:oligosaccharide flippase family protein [Roseococcus sp. MDT2-1-1]MCW8088091.1 oligosaccharide flippase family protein [Roseococcus sp. MDT2-1-1]